MFLANIVWESDGLRAKEEYLCKQTPGACTSAYGAGNGRGSYFWGRGYIQLSWADNYRAASQALFGNDQLVQNPQQVSSNEDVAWGVSYWYWNSRVRNSPGVLAGNFGASINAINGPLECRGGHSDKAKKRFVIYTAILKIFAPSEAPKETGCYN
ncbi:hypothetical protein GGI12_005532 [Dipsacomyces acuminosporus]|nr:hypothetical protein GGI12_005532 [Dipsacomyces acuminosporus]